MIKRKAEVDPLKSYNADSGLIGYLDKRLKLSKEMEQLDGPERNSLQKLMLVTKA